jgi:hypothetical protein
MGVLVCGANAAITLRTSPAASQKRGVTVKSAYQWNLLKHSFRKSSPASKSHKETHMLTLNTHNTRKREHFNPRITVPPRSLCRRRLQVQINITGDQRCGGNGCIVGRDSVGSPKQAMAIRTIGPIRSI